MPRPAKPWFRASANAWYATLNGRKVSLGVQGEGNHADALKAWHRLMAEGVKPKPQAKPQAPTVKAVLNAFLADAKGRVSAGCLANYRLALLAFAKRFGSRPADTLTAADTEAYARKPEWSVSYRNGILGSLISAFRWAERSGLVRRNPLHGLRKPPKASRGAKTLVSPEIHARLCEHARPLFRAFLQLLWLTGARPGEIASLRAEDVDLSQGLAVLTDHKTAHLGKSRVLFLTPEAVAVIRGLNRTEGLLFPTPTGRVMRPARIGRRLRRLCRKAGVKRIMAYGYRHSFATDALARGVPDAQVAALLGHSGTNMLHKHYAHLTAKAKALRDALTRARPA